MSNVLTESDRYIAFVFGLYRRDPARVILVYEALYPESHCWPEGGIAYAQSLAEIDETISALIDQDAQDGHDAWAFRDTFDEEGEAWAGPEPTENQG